ncbi:MAG: PDC sensor domain-containing protein [Sedimentisphaerales bacterium]|nr:PDC sensor domain-containing protein [Sedimentisphaerales bacterium]
MRLRNKLLILLLIISLVPLIVYFLLDVTFTLIARDRLERTFKATLENRAEETLVETIDHYEEILKMSAQAVRYALRHYANQVQQCLWAVDTDVPSSPHPYLTWLSNENLANAPCTYRLVTPTGSRDYDVDFESQLLFPEQEQLVNPLSTDLPQLTETCKEIYSFHPESRVWIYTVLTDGTTTIYPSVGFWPYEPGYDLRLQPWFINTRRSRRLTPTPYIEPLTGKSVMTVAMPLFEQDSTFAGVVALDIDLSGLLDTIKIPESWLEGA